MNTFTNNLTAADTVARQLIQERVQDAERRAQVRAVRAARRAARQAYQPYRPRPVTPPQTRELPWWAFRFRFSAS
jgi:hypothetical protein